MEDTETSDARSSDADATNEQLTTSDSECAMNEVEGTVVACLQQRAEALAACAAMQRQLEAQGKEMAKLREETAARQALLDLTQKSCEANEQDYKLAMQQNGKLADTVDLKEAEVQRLQGEVRRAERGASEQAAERRQLQRAHAELQAALAVAEHKCGTAEREVVQLRAAHEPTSHADDMVTKLLKATEQAAAAESKLRECVAEREALRLRLSVSEAAQQEATLALSRAESRLSGAAKSAAESDAALQAARDAAAQVTSLQKEYLWSMEQRLRAAENDSAAVRALLTRARADHDTAAEKVEGVIHDLTLELSTLKQKQQRQSTPGLATPQPTVATEEQAKWEERQNQMIAFLSHIKEGLSQCTVENPNGAELLLQLQQELSAVVPESFCGDLPLEVECANLKRDVTALTQQRDDLSLQVQQLLKECVERDGGSYMQYEETQPSLQEDGTVTSANTITSRLVTFSDIQELQQHNIELLACVRKLSEESEEAERTIRERTDEQVAQHLEQLREERREERGLVASLTTQRDTFKQLYEEASTKALALEKEMKDNTEMLEHIKRRSSELVSAAEVAQQAEQSARHEASAATAAAVALRTECAEATAARDVAQEKIRDLSQQTERLTTEFASLRKQRDEARVSVAALTSQKEQTYVEAAQLRKQNAALNRSVASLSKQKSRLEAKAEKVATECTELRQARDRLTASLRSEKDAAAVAAEAEATTVAQLQRDATVAREKACLYERQLDDAREQFGVAQGNWLATHVALQAQVSSLQEQYDALMENHKLQLEQRSGGPLSVAATAEPSEAAMTLLRTLVATLRVELEKERAAAAEAKRVAAEASRLASGLRAACDEQSRVICEMTSAAEKQSRKVSEERAAIERREAECETLREQCSTREQAAAAEAAAHSAECAELRARVDRLQQQAESLRDQITQKVELLKQAQQQYTAELVAHSKHIKEHGSLTSTLSSLRENEARAQSELARLTTKLAADHAASKERQQQLESAFAALQQRCTDAEKHRDSMLSQLEVLTQLQKQRGDVGDVEQQLATLKHEKEQWESQRETLQTHAHKCETYLVYFLICYFLGQFAE
eukprot:TRINITY_DN2253_c0_g1_i2.p1 TRINITY_DN2253_c0_g1~~TRINITY_DN2253_c0_g1_i2.p1  ORF type:complete len:1085 (+),score=374.63 TRINITY_DN2253_c0_g1_i2:1-3255(+)